MSAKKEIFFSVNELIEEIRLCRSLVSDSEKYDEVMGRVSGKNNYPRFISIVPEKFLTKHCKTLQENLTSADKSLLSNFMTATNGKSAIVGSRVLLTNAIGKYFEEYYDAFLESTILSVIAIDNKDILPLNQAMPNVYSKLVNASYTPIDITRNSGRKLDELRIKNALVPISKYIIYMYIHGNTVDFLMWLFLFALLQDNIVKLSDKMKPTQYPRIIKYLEPILKPNVLFSNVPSLCIDDDDFWDLRRYLVSTSQGHIIIAGASLRDAFRKGDEHQIITELSSAIRKRQLQRVSILITDPCIFDESGNYGQPIRDINEAIQSLQENFYQLIHETSDTDYPVELHIYFLPLLQIDHAVITDEFMAFRSNKLWNYNRYYKGNYMIHLANYYHPSNVSEYEAHRDYLDMIMRNSTIIYPEMDMDETPPEKNSPRSYHMEWRSFLIEKKYKNIYLHKLYEKQLYSVVCDSWSSESTYIGYLSPNTYVKTRKDLFDPSILLNDRTQKVLLPYIQETERLFTRAIQKHDSREGSACRIFPSLDLGFPNNVQRLAGGFATGMLVTWQCGIDIIPIDATINICTSSVYKLTNFDKRLLDKDYFYQIMEQFSREASDDKGYSFSFTTGNHFLMISEDRNSGDYYLVMHSSANELKHSYMGLYPVEGNWYSDKIKHIDGDNGRYFRYLKDEDAKYFIKMVQNFEKYNEQIHQWLAAKFNGKTVCKDESWIAHHYYMPTSNSIAIGTFAEPVGAQIPIFSNYEKPIYIFEIGKNNWQVNLGGRKGNVCLVPHGWGQQIETIKSIEVSDGELILHTDSGDFKKVVKSQEHIDCPEKRIRMFADGESFFRIGGRYIQGKIIKTLYPVIEYSSHSSN